MSAKFHDSYMRALELNFTEVRASAQIDDYVSRLSAVSLATADRFGIDMDAGKQAEQIAVLQDFWARRGDYAAG